MKQVNFIKTLWGVHIDLTSLSAIKSSLQGFKTQGFAGIEIATGFFDNTYKSDFNKVRKELDLKLITQIHTLGYPVPRSKSQQHIDDFKKKVEDSLTWEPDMINTHDGRDDWSFYESVNYFIRLSEYEKSLKTVVPIVHETHRQRILHNHKITHDVMKFCPDIHLNADLSHWVVSAERLLNDQTDEKWHKILHLLCKRSKLIHARVASPNQIQVIDPSSEDNRENREWFYNIWRKIYDESVGKDLFVTLEYGPSPYAICNPGGENVVPVEKVINDELVSLQKLFK
jgi:hypothetical protein